MSILIDKLPQKVVIDNTEYVINSDFRTSIKFENTMLKNDIDEVSKLIESLKLYYPVIPENFMEGFNKIIWFYSCGNEKENSKSNTNNSSGNSKTKIYDLNYDADYIYSAFMSQYNIDLQDIEYLHWWKFKALFKALNDDNKIVKIMEYRSIDLSKIKDKSQKDFYKKMKKIYEIPMPKEDKEKLDEINNIMLNGGNIGDISKII